MDQQTQQKVIICSIPESLMSVDYLIGNCCLTDVNSNLYLSACPCKQ